MIFWIREIAGWLLVMFALYMLRLGMLFLTNSDSPQIIEAGIAIIAGLGVLRAGLLLIRISAAARLVLSDRSNKK